jgi:hypothetical protein
MRLGLVRYQPFAPAQLRVSEPVVEWLQIPQRRTVTAEIDANSPRHLKVTVSGTGSTHSTSGPNGDDKMRIESWTQRPVMKITVLRQRHDGVEDVALLDPKSALCVAGYSNRAERAWLPRTQLEWTEELTLRRDSRKPREQCAVQPTHPGRDSTLSWCAEFALDDDPLKPKSAGTAYSVLVEEVQPMLPATYSNEPFDTAAALDQQELTWTGPRFAARVELTTKHETPNLNEPPLIQPPLLRKRVKIKPRLRRRQSPPPAPPQPT